MFINKIQWMPVVPGAKKRVIYELIHNTVTGRYTLAADGRQLARSGWRFSVCFCITAPIAAGISAKFSCSKRSDEDDTLVYACAVNGELQAPMLVSPGTYFVACRVSGGEHKLVEASAFAQPPDASAGSSRSGAASSGSRAAESERCTLSASGTASGMTSWLISGGACPVELVEVDGHTDDVWVDGHTLPESALDTGFLDDGPGSSVTFYTPRRRKCRLLQRIRPAGERVHLLYEVVDGVAMLKPRAEPGELRKHMQALQSAAVAASSRSLLE